MSHLPIRPSRPTWRNPAAATLGVLFLLVLLILGACQPRAEDPVSSPRESDIAAEPQRGGTMVVASTADVDSLNELTTKGSRATTDVLRLMFLNLVEEQPDSDTNPPTFKPQIAESWEFSEDGLQLTIKLRNDLVWSDGEPITADDVLFTWEAQLHPEVAWRSRDNKTGAIERLEKLDDHTVVFHLKRKSPQSLNLVNDGHILPRHAWSKLPFDEWRTESSFFAENLVVSGPFKLDHWKPGQELALVRNERYFDAPKPYLDGIVFRIVPDSSQQATQLLVGDADFVSQVPVDTVERFESEPSTDVFSYWHRALIFFEPNHRRPPFDDPMVRRAITLASDREGIVETIWGPYGRVADSPYVKNSWAHDPNLEPWPYDPDEARRILAERGFTDSDGDGIIERDGEPFSFDLMTNTGNQERLDAATLLQEQLRRVGIDLNVRVIEWNTMISRLTEFDFDASILGYSMPTTLDYYFAFHRDAVELGSNHTGYSTPECDAAIEAIRNAETIEDMRVALLEFQRIVHQDQPLTLLWESQRINAYNSRLRNVQSNLLALFWDIEDWWFAPEN